MKTFKQLQEDLYINDLADLCDVLSNLSEEDVYELIEDGILSEEEGNFLIEANKEETNKKVTDTFKTIGDTAAGYARGVLGRERFNRWGGKIRSKVFGTSPEEEQKKLEKDYEIRSKRSPTASGRGEKSGEIVRKYVVPGGIGMGVGKALKPAIGTVPAVIAGGTAGAAVRGAMDITQPDVKDKEPVKTDTPVTTEPNKPQEPPKAPEPVKTKEPVELPKSGGDAARLKPDSSDNLEKAKELIKKREETKSPLYKLGDIAGGLFGGSKEVQDGVADTYRRLQKDPKAASEFLKIQQQRNKDMGL